MMTSFDVVGTLGLSDAKVETSHAAAILHCAAFGGMATAQ